MKLIINAGRQAYSAGQLHEPGTPVDADPPQAAIWIADGTASPAPPPEPTPPPPARPRTARGKAARVPGE